MPGGRLAGAIWFEHDETIRAWKSEDISFTRAVAGMLALRLAATGTPDETDGPNKSDKTAGHSTNRTSVSKSASAISTVDKTGSNETAGPKQAREHRKGNGQKISFPERLLKQGLAQSSIKADVYDNVTVLVLRFTDPLALAEYFGDGDKQTSAVDHLICHFEDLLEAQWIDYWKIIGEKIICAAGMQDTSIHPVDAIADLALRFQDACSHLFADLDKPMEFTIGIDTGGVIGSPVGRRRKTYNIWGEAFNAASMMADNGVTGGIQVSETTYRRLRQNYLFKVRGRYYLQNIGEISTYLLTGRI
jgi:class 3 adenylate cyclase